MTVIWKRRSERAHSNELLCFVARLLLGLAVLLMQQQHVRQCLFQRPPRPKMTFVVYGGLTTCCPLLVLGLLLPARPQSPTRHHCRNSILVGVGVGRRLPAIMATPSTTPLEPQKQSCNTPLLRICPSCNFPTCPTLLYMTESGLGTAETQTSCLEHSDRQLFKRYSCSTAALTVSHKDLYHNANATTTDLPRKARAQQKGNTRLVIHSTFCQVTTAQQSNLVYMGGVWVHRTVHPDCKQDKTKPATADATTTDNVMQSVLNSVRRLTKPP